jgi:hypothetical protein
MPIQPSILLKRLEPAVRPMSASRAEAPRGEVEFESLLQLVSSGEPVGGAVQASGKELDEGQQKRLAAAADLATAHGFDRVIVMLDGRSLLLDVRERAVKEEVKAGHEAGLVQVDAVVHAADPNAAPPQRPLGPPSSVAPAAIQRSIHSSIIPN